MLLIKKENESFYALLLMVFSTLCFANIPLYLRSNVLSSGYSGKLTWYPLIALASYYLYQLHKGYIHPERLKITPVIFVKFLLTYLSVTLLSTFLGLIIFPYADLYAGHGTSSAWVYYVSHFLTSFKMDLTPAEIFKIQIILRTIKGTVLSALYTWGFSYVLYYFISKKTIFYYNLLIKGIHISLGFLFSYSFIEIFYLMGSDYAVRLIADITPFFHAIGENGSWWPPLFFPDRLRSIFAEPSYLGLYAAFIMPFLWEQFLEKKILINGSIVFLFSFMIFMTQSRTAVLIFLVEEVLFILLVLFSHNKQMLLKVSFMLGISLLAFSTTIFFPYDLYKKNVAEVNLHFNSRASKYLNENVSSVAKTEVGQKSNNSRYSVLKANVALGIDYPILGVGTNLNSAYLPDYINDDALVNNIEIQKWIKDMKQNGMLVSGIPNMGEYVTRFSQNGLVGLTMFMVPWITILLKMPKKLVKLRSDTKHLLKVGTIFIAFLGTLIGGCGDNLTILYTPWILLSFAFSFTFEKLEDL